MNELHEKDGARGLARSRDAGSGPKTAAQFVFAMKPASFMSS
jgi:hypothetical protein